MHRSQSVNIRLTQYPVDRWHWQLHRLPSHGVISRVLYDQPCNSAQPLELFCCSCNPTFGVVPRNYLNLRALTKEIYWL
jgi:hypothetical protein